MDPAGHAPESAGLAACRGCDTLHALGHLPARCEARCAVCGTLLHRAGGRNPSSAAALSLAGLLLYLPANLLPVMTVSLLGEARQTTLAGGALALWKGGFPMVAALTLLVGVVLPACKLAGLLYVTAPLAWGRRAPGAQTALRLHEHVEEWGMLEVYLLGLLISVVKLREIVDIETGPGLYGLAATALCVVVLSLALDPEDLWRRLSA